MDFEELMKEIDRLIEIMGQRIDLFEAYVKQNGLEADFERFCEEKKRNLENKKWEKHPTKEQIPR